MKRHFLTVLCLLSLFFAGCFNLNVNVPALQAGGQNQAKSNDSSDKSGTSGLPSLGNGDWKGIATGLGGYMMGAEDGVLFFAYDTLAYPTKEVALAAKVQLAPKLNAVEGVTLSFYLDDKAIGSAKTDKSGLAHIYWTPPKAGNYQFYVKVTSVKEDYANMLKLTPAPLLVAARDRKTEFVVIDMDHTLVESSFFRVLMGGAKPMPHSVHVTNKIAKKYGVVYLTQRPDVLTSKSKGWLKENGYPAGPVMLAGVKEFLDSGKFKTGKIKQFRKAYPGVKIGIGDKFSDAEAYVANGMTAYLIPHFKDKPKDMRKTAGKVYKLRKNKNMNVVEDWWDIEQAFFAGKHFSAADFARALDKRAAKLEAEKRARKKKDDDDDDDDDD